MKWTKKGPDYTAGPYRIHTEGDAFHVDMPVNGGVFDTVSEAKRWCSDHEQELRIKKAAAKAAAEAPPMSVEMQRDIAAIFDVEGNAARKRAERKPHPASAPPPPGLQRRSLPGEPTHTNEERLKELRQRWDEGMARSPLFALHHSNALPEDVFRWRIQLDCGCIVERYTNTDDPQSLLDRSDENPLTGKKLPPGDYVCRNQEHWQKRAELPLRDIASWDECLRQRDLPADPVDPPEDWHPDLDARAQLWSEMRRPEPVTVYIWAATLTCGHQIEVQHDADWTPDQPMKRATPERLAELRAGMIEPVSLYLSKLLDAGWPELGSSLDCSACKIVGKPVAYEPLGWLVPPPPRPPKPRERKTPKQRAEARLKQVEREAKRLRAELKEME